MQIKYTLVQQDELTLIHAGKAYTKDQLKDNEELLAIFENLEDTGNILFPEYAMELGGNKVLVGAHAVRGDSKIHVDFKTNKMTIT